MAEERGTLRTGEPHPSVKNALACIGRLNLEELMAWQASFSSCAIGGNRLAEVCAETLRRLMDKEPVSDRYLLGLAWAMRKTPSAQNPAHPQRSEAPEHG